MSHDGWLEDKSLPPKWLYKDNGKKNGYSFLSKDATFFRSILEVMKFTNDNEIVACIKLFLETRKKVYNNGKDLAEGWTHDSTVPNGWMLRKIGGITQNTHHVLSPDKQHFSARRSALKFLIEKKYPEEEIQAMRDCLEYDGWLQSPALPQNWFYKPRDNKNTNVFLDSEGNYYKSMIEVLKEVRNKKFENNIKQFLDTKSTYTKIKSLGSSWKSGDPSVPSGWRIRQVGNSKVKNSYHLLSPENQHFAGRRLALKYLVDKSYPDDDIEEMRKCMKHDGWLEDPRLPLKWFYKSKNDGSHLYLDAKGNFFESKDAVLRDYSQEEHIVCAVKDFLGSITPVYNKGKEIDSSWILGILELQKVGQ